MKVKYKTMKSLDIRVPIVEKPLYDSNDKLVAIISGMIFKGLAKCSICPVIYTTEMDMYIAPEGEGITVFNTTVLERNIVYNKHSAYSDIIEKYVSTISENTKVYNADIGCHIITDYDIIKLNDTPNMLTVKHSKEFADGEVDCSLIQYSIPDNNSMVIYKMCMDGTLYLDNIYSLEKLKIDIEQ